MNSKYMFIVAVMTVMLVGATAFATGNAFAKYGSQAISQVNKCGNDKMPMYVFCRNTDSQVQGEDNGVAVAGAQQSEEDRRGGGHDGGYDGKDQSAAAPSADQSANIAPPANEGGDGGYDDEAAPGTEATTGMNEHSNEADIAPPADQNAAADQSADIAPPADQSADIAPPADQNAAAPPADQNANPLVW